MAMIKVVKSLLLLSCVFLTVCAKEYSFNDEDDDVSASLLYNPLNFQAVLIKKYEDCRGVKASSNIIQWQCECCLVRAIDTFKGHGDVDLQRHLKAECSSRTTLCQGNALQQVMNSTGVPVNSLLTLAEKLYLNLTLARRLDVNHAMINHNGFVVPEHLPNMLALAFKEHKLADPHFSNHNCMKAKGLETNTGKSMQMLKLDSQCANSEGPGNYLVLEKRNEIHECFKLRQIAEIPGMQQMLGWTGWAVKGFPIIALPRHCVSYVGQNDEVHYLSIMPRAAGSSLQEILRDYSEEMKQDSSCTNVVDAMKQIGTTLSNFQQRFSLNTHDDKSTRGRYLADTLVHGDLHMSNIFAHVPTERVTIIDSSGFNKYQAHPFCDIFKMVMHPFRIPGSGHFEYHFVPSRITAASWFPLTFVFIKAYILAFDPERRLLVLAELRAMFNDPKTYDYALTEDNHSYPQLTNYVHTFLNPRFDQLKSRLTADASITENYPRGCRGW